MADAIGYQGMVGPPAITPAPHPHEVAHKVELIRRDGTQTCGYVAADSESYFYCSPGWLCARATQYRAGFCCRSSAFPSCSLAATSCIDATDVAASCDSACLANSHIAKCTFPGSSYCKTLIYSQTDLSYFLTGYGCDYPHAVTTVYPYYTYSGSSYSALVETRRDASWDDSSTTSETSTSSSQGPSSTPVTTPGVSPSTPTPQSSSQRALSGGAIAGLVVGILAAIVILVGIIFLYRYFRTQQRQRHQQQNQQQPQMSSGGGNVVPMPPQPQVLTQTAPSFNTPSEQRYSSPASSTQPFIPPTQSPTSNGGGFQGELRFSDSASQVGGPANLYVNYNPIQAISEDHSDQFTSETPGRGWSPPVGPTESVLGPLNPNSQLQYQQHHGPGAPSTVATESTFGSLPPVRAPGIHTTPYQNFQAASSPPPGHQTSGSS